MPGRRPRKIECDSLVTLYGRALKRAGRHLFPSTPVGGRLISRWALARICSTRWARATHARWYAAGSSRRAAMIALMPHWAKLRRRKASDSRFFDSFGRHGVTALSSHPRGSAAVTLTRGLFPSLA